MPYTPHSDLSSGATYVVHWSGLEKTPETFISRVVYSAHSRSKLGISSSAVELDDLQLQIQRRRPVRLAGRRPQEDGIAPAEKISPRTN